MTNGDIGAKEHIQILLAEYNSLRSEINARMSSVYQVVAITAVVAVWLLQQRFGMRLYLGVAAAAVGLALCAWALMRDCVRAALRVKQLEREINRRAGEHLLVWESEWGGQTSSLWALRVLHILLGVNRPPYSE
jgi:hypothetical protein